MTTIAELVVQNPGAATGVPIQVSYGSGEWRLVVQLADPAAGASVVWYDVTEFVSEFKWKRGGDQPFGRYQPCRPELLFWGDGDQFATWNEDTSATFGTHVRLRGGLLVRAVVFRVVSAAVDLAFPLFTARVKKWGDGLAALGRVRFHRVECLDTMSKFVNKPLGAQFAEGWKSRLDDLLVDAEWQFGADIYGAVSVDATPTITVDDRDEVPSAITELDATLDPVGLVWRTQPNGRLLVHPAPWTTFHDDIFGGAGTIVGDEWVSPTKAYYPTGVKFSYQPIAADGEVGFRPQVAGQSFGIESDVENVVNEWKVTHPSGTYSYDDPVSASSYDNRPHPAATWIAQNDDVVDDYVDTRAYADMVATQLNTDIDLRGFFPACAILDQWDDVSVLHATGLDRATVTGTGWLRSIEHTIKNRRAGRISWKSVLQLDLTSSVQSDPLLPVENLAVVATDPAQVDFTWTNPTQTVTPTETQVRIPELSDQWLPIAYPTTGFAWLWLDPDTQYTFQVRLVRIVDEITTNVSPVREVVFTTDAAAVPTPGPGDGTTVIIPDPGGESCTTDWKLEESDDNGATWTTTTTGDESDFVENDQGDLELDLSAVSFVDGLLYRLCTNTDCGSGPEGWVCSAPFQPACATPAQLSTAPFDDALMFVPEVCGAAIFEAVSDTEAVPGPAFAGIGTDVDGNYIITSGASAGVVIYGDAPNMPLTDGDRSIHWRGKIDTATAEDILLRVGRLRIAIIDVGSSVYKFAAIKSFAGGSITAIGTTTVASDTEYDVFATWDRDTATVAIIVDGTEEDTTEDAASYVNTPNLPTFSARLPADSWCTELAAWDRVVASTVFSPSAIAGMELWIDASDTATITESPAGSLTGINDKSGNGNNMGRNGTTGTIVTGTYTQNGLNVLDFDGANRYLWAQPADFTPSDIETNRALTVAMVVRPDASGDSLFSLPKINNQDHQTLIVEQSSGTQKRITMGDGANYGGAGDLLEAYFNSGTGAFQLIVVRVDTSGYSMREDGVELSVASTASSMPIANFLATSTGDMWCHVAARQHSSGTYPMDGRLAEVCLYNTYLTGTDLTDLENYLMTKWGL